MSTQDTPIFSGPPWLGAAYYPEDWPAEQVDEDIRLMGESGINCVRVAEFAWSSMEPEEGQYDFAWLHRVLDKLGAAGISCVMCTPTATPPIWLTEKHPEILWQHESAMPITHGGRRHYDPCNSDYLEHCRRTTARMAEEFGDRPEVIAWQIDNEIFPPNYMQWWEFPPCNTKAFRDAFYEWMRERFQTIENLNAAWCTSLWSQTYQRFDQLPFPNSKTWHHPSLKTAWREFTQHAFIEFVRVQADILHEKASQPVGTNMIMIPGMDFHRMNAFLDVVQFDHYHLGPGFKESCFWFDLLRPVKQDQPFWNMESTTSWPGAESQGDLSERGFCRANTWLPIAQGGEMNAYWLWRTHWAGQELHFGAVLQSCGRPFHIVDEIQSCAEEFKRSADFINDTKCENTGLAIHFSTAAHHMFTDQPMSRDFNYFANLVTTTYYPLIAKHFRPDVIAPCSDLTPYRVVLSPFLPALDEDGLRERLLAWIEKGGVWIAGPLTDNRTTEGTKYTHAPFGSLEEWAGVYTHHQIAGNERRMNVKWPDGTDALGSVWYDAFEAHDADILATYTEWPVKGLAAIITRQIGKGRIVLLGTMPPPEQMTSLIQSVGVNERVKPVVRASENLLCVPRTGAAGRGLVVVELDNKTGDLDLPDSAEDMFTGETVEGRISIAPYGVRVLRFTR